MQEKFLEAIIIFFPYTMNVMLYITLLQKISILKGKGCSEHRNSRPATHTVFVSTRTYMHTRIPIKKLNSVFFYLKTKL